jgi:PhnB protein
MAERDLIQQLDQAVVAMLGGGTDGKGVASYGPEVTSLMLIATALRDLPDEDFRAQLKRDVMANAIKEKNMATTETRAQQVSGQAETPASQSSQAETPAPRKTWIREGFRSVTPYLLAPRSAGLMDFMKAAFGATELLNVPRPDGSIMHAEVRIGDSIIEMAENPPDEYGARPTPLHVYVPDVDAAYTRALVAGGTSIGEVRDQAYGERSGNIRDGAGNNWYIATANGASHVPEGSHSVNICFHLNGAAGFIDFLKRAFGASEVMRHATPDGTVAHAKLQIGDSLLEMSEAHGQWQPMPCAIHLYVPDADTMYRQAIEAGATSMAAPADTSYGDRFAAVRDPQGNQWYIATRLPNQ